MIDPPTAAATAAIRAPSKPPSSPPKVEDDYSSGPSADLKRDVSSITNSNNGKSSTNTMPMTNTVTASNDASATSASSPKRRTKRRPLHVEAIVHPSCPTDLSVIRSEVKRHVQAVGRKLMQYQSGTVDLADAPDVIRNGCARVIIADLEEHFDCTTSDDGAGGGRDGNAVGTWLISSVVVHAYVLSDEEASAEELEIGDGNDDEDLTACETLSLPHSTLHGLWDSIILPRGIKSNLLEYASSAMLFSDRSVSTHIIGWNRVILLHGPPGTGKTTLCRALAHKLTVRLSDRFVNGGYLLEVHSHSLFSKWFSESGKLVSRLFDRIREMVEDDPDALVCVLVDEVESLAAARSAGTGGAAGEPSDAVRAVNSLLTSIDRLRQYGNVIVMTTSNISENVDVAFVDRADVKQYIGLPIVEARYEILRSCVLELIRVGIVRVGREEEDDMEISSDNEAECSTSGGDMATEVAKTMLPPHRQLRRLQSSSALSTAGSALLRCAELADGMSGRGLRKLPFQSHALFVRSADPVPLDEFLHALRGGVEKEQESRKAMKETSSSNGASNGGCKCECTKTNN